MLRMRLHDVKDSPMCSFMCQCRAELIALVRPVEGQARGCSPPLVLGVGGDCDALALARLGVMYLLTSSCIPTAAVLG